MHKPVNTTHPLPPPFHPGAFGVIRKYDIHTGVDLYCEPGSVIHAVEDGIVVAIEKFTGADVGSPWWHDTWAVLIEGASGVIVYGEARIHYYIQPGYEVVAGELLGVVERVLKTDKGVTPTTMLHFELLKPGSTSTGWWHHGEEQPDYLLDPTPLLKKIYEPE